MRVIGITVTPLKQFNISMNDYDEALVMAADDENVADDEEEMADDDLSDDMDGDDDADDSKTTDDI